MGRTVDACGACGGFSGRRGWSDFISEGQEKPVALPEDPKYLREMAGGENTNTMSLRPSAIISGCAERIRKHLLWG